MSAIQLFDLNGEQRFTGTSVGGGASGPFAAATVTLTNAQIKALPTTPVELVAAPGAGKVLVPIFCWMHLTWVADYTNIDVAAVIKFAYANLAGCSLASIQEVTDGGVTNLLADGASHPAYIGPLMGVVGSHTVGVGQFADDPDPINSGLGVHADNSGNFTGGDAGNSLKVTVYYATFTN